MRQGATIVGALQISQDLDEVDQRVAAVQRTLIAVAIVATIIAVAIAYFIIARIVRPLAVVLHDVLGTLGEFRQRGFRIGLADFVARNFVKRRFPRHCRDAKKKLQSVDKLGLLVFRRARHQLDMPRAERPKETALVDTIHAASVVSHGAKL